MLTLSAFIFSGQAQAEQHAPGNADCSRAFNNDTCVISNDYVNSCSGSAPNGMLCVVHDFHNGIDKCYCWEDPSQTNSDCSNSSEDGDDGCVYLVD